MKNKSFLFIGISIFICFLVFSYGLKRLSLYEVKNPVFSAESGFYQEEFELELTTESKDAVIYYTVDGTTPDRTSMRYVKPVHIYDYSVNPNVYSVIDEIAFEDGYYGYVYTPMEKVNKAMVVRAVVYGGAEEEIKSEVITKTYFVGLDYGELPVISLVTEPDNLFGYENGIYVKGQTYEETVARGKGNPHWSNFCNKGKEWERPALFTLFKNNELQYQKEIGIRVRGGSTRYFEQKSFSLYAEGENDKTSITYEILPDNLDKDGKTVREYDSLMLRNWGNNFRLNIFADPLIQKLSADRSISTQSSSPCILFLNGEYWGLYDLKEKYGEEYFRQHFGVDREDIIMVKAQHTANGLGRAVETGSEDYMTLYNELEAFATENDLSLQENYEAICGKMDIQSFIDLFAIRIYTEAVDFPTNNWACWRTKTVNDKPYHDGKWRFMLYDVDVDMRYANYYNGYEIAQEYSILFSSLMKNDEFRKQFILTIMDLSNINFSPSKVEFEYNIMYDMCKPFMSEYYDRFGPIEVGGGTNETAQMAYFDLQREMTLNFFNNQRGYMEQLLLSEKAVEGAVHEVRVYPEGTGEETIIVNTSQIQINKSGWSGHYFSDYPIELGIREEDESRFAGWYGRDGELLGTESTLQLDMDNDIAVTARFRQKESE